MKIEKNIPIIKARNGKKISTESKMADQILDQFEVGDSALLSRSAIKYRYLIMSLKRRGGVKRFITRTEDENNFRIWRIR